MAQSALLQLVPEASESLVDILDPRRGPVPPPIRSEIFGAQRFAQHGRSLGDTHRAEPASSTARTFVPRLRSNIRALREAHRYIGAQQRTGYDISPAAEWLLDNFHLIEAQLKEVQEGLPRSYFRALPVLLDEPLAGLPRIYGVAWAFVAHTDGAFDEGLLAHFLAGYQETRALNLGELWALPTSLRVLLIENLRRLAERVASNKAAREVANLCGDHIDRYRTADLDQLLALLEARGVGRTFLGQLAQRLQEGRTAADVGPASEAQAWLRRLLPDPSAAQAQQSADQAADNLSVSNAVTALRAIGDADWAELIAGSSTLMQLMLTAPWFEAEHQTTRTDSLHAIERWARRSGRSELTVAHTLLGLMQADPGPAGAPRVAAHWLQGEGQAAFARALDGDGARGIGLRWRWWAQALRPRLALPAYLGALLIGSLGLVVWMLLQHRAGSDAAGVSVSLGLLAAALMLFPASEAVVAVINRLISESLRPRHLPRLAFAHGIPAEHRVLVVIPALLTGAASIDELVHRLQLHYLANPEAQAQFALLSDFADADSADLPSDGAWLAAATEAIAALNRRHPAGHGAAPRFILLHRARRYSETERRWIGWERKRGKLEQLLAQLAGGPSGAFLDLGAVSQPAPQTRYVVTLDADTQLPPGRLRELVGVAAHPSNQPRLDPSGLRVVEGYAVLQPRIATPLPAPRELTLFHALFAGQTGIDPYSAASSEVYQDLFGEGSFTGKGLLHVQAMHAVLGGRLPEGRVLSHDLLEGSIARCAAVTDITLVEDAPFHADVAASRVHRWTRGDWQLLPFLCQPRRYPVCAINRWKMFDNLRRSLVAPMSLGFLLLAFATGVVAPWAALLLVGAAFTAGPLMGAVAGLSPSRDDIAKLHFYRQAGLELARAVCGGLWHGVQLLAQAMWSLDAIGRALYRMVVSRRHLLQWTTAAAAQARASVDLPTVLRQHLAVPLTALALGAGLLAAGAAAWPMAWLLGLLLLVWAASPVAVWWVSRPRPVAADAALPGPARAHYEAVARDTWAFFERCVTADDHHLPPDNLQTAPHDMLAHRTSPTNIGLYLLATACAQAFGWIGVGELLARLEATLATLERLERHRGHFLNWYDTQTLAPLLPKYVSTVDSGNLSGHLLAVAQACQALARASGTHWEEAQRLSALALSFERLAWEADFGFLYHRKRHLLHIGYRVAEQQLDSGFYDLLASESRLTSLLAIAKGDVPVRHWAALGRPFHAVGAAAGLRSWSGSMFEYLMPGLVLDEPVGSVLHGAACAAIVEQIAHGREHQVPWGVSESAYAGRDQTLAYQYSPQGVPRLALRRTPPDELVIAPYATLLAAPLAPRRAMRNLAVLDGLGARGAYGYIEALDFTPARQAGADRVTPVHTFMAHHQGMALVSLANLLLDGVARRWGMANAHVEAVASLLHERSPREVSVLDAPPAWLRPPDARRAPGMLREVDPGLSALQPTHVLSNGRYSVTLRANGAGWSRRGAQGIGRWRDDALRDAHGSFFWLRWDRHPTPVTLTHHPAPDPAASYRSSFHADRVCFDARWPELHAQTTVWVSPEDDIEFRQVELRNLGSRTLDLELMSAFDVTLADPRADEAHPAFSNLFVRAEWLAEQQALWFERRPRLVTEQGLQAAHFLIPGEGGHALVVRAQTDRQRWLGRNQSAAAPMASLEALPTAADAAPAGLDTGLDPVAALGVQLRLAPHAKVCLTFATAASDDPATLRAVIDKYRQASHVQRASLMSATLAGIRLRSLRISAENFAVVQNLTTALVLTLTRPPLPAAAEAGGGRVCDRRLLWRFGISGDRPILLVSTGVMQGLGLLRSLSQALRLWAWGGVACDLVVVNAEAASYQMALQREIMALREQHGAETAPGSHTGPASTSFHLLRAEELSADELSTLQTLARVALNADGRPLQHHVAAWAEQHERAGEQRDADPRASVPVASAPGGAVPAPTGSFAAASGEFRFEVSARLRPLRPWINVLSNRGFGAQISEAGGGYTWAVNSRLNQLTTWSNDPVADPPSETFLLQDPKTLVAWSLCPSAHGDASLNYRVSHGQGETRIAHRRGDLAVEAAWSVDAQSSVKQVVVQLANRGGKVMQLRVVGLVEWVMGANRSDRGSTETAVLHQRLPGHKLTALTCTQRERSAGFGDGTAFFALASVEERGGLGDDWTCDRREFFDDRGHLVLPDLLGQRSGHGLDPCAALSSVVTIAPGESVERVFLLGYGADPAAARELAVRAAAVPAAQRLAQVKAWWTQLLGATVVKTPDPLFDVMVNRWLLYQTVSSRLWAKAGFYQAGGATGFRDQLQDAMALAWAAPTMLREQILVCASRQFPQGDVQHWWHAPGGAGVRTHFSDDLLWLPLACAHYLRSSGDRDLLDEAVPFLEGAPIPEGAEDAYYAPTVGSETASVYEHAARTIDRSLRVGAHGLPLMGTGDWNDGMNRVGHEGRGESVWLGWFLCRVIDGFAPLARQRGETERASRWEAAAQALGVALRGEAWDGQWFRRAYFDGGEPLGSRLNSEARIDLIAQAWAVLSDVATPTQQHQALAAVEQHLVDPDAGLLRLLDPPLAQSVPSAGYIQAYPPGVRENGGQYSHAGVWALMARAHWDVRHPDDGRAGQASADGGDAVYRNFTWLSPAHRAKHPRHGAVYGIEPYVMAGDVYSQPPYVGRGGWSWYTGAAAWLHRAAIESMFGLRQTADSLCFDPCLPSHWPRAELRLQRDGRTLLFILLRVDADSALASQAGWQPPPGARLLRCGEPLEWTRLGEDSCFVVPLGAPVNVAQRTEPFTVP